MATSTTVRKTVPKSAAPAAPGDTVKEALQVTWVLKGHLKNAQIAYLRVGSLLAAVRDKKLYAALHHPDMESYAMARLQLARASLYRYLQVHDWAAECHKEWLEPNPKGFIPDLADATNMIWIEKELQRKDLGPQTRTKLESLLKQALSGQLDERALNKIRHGTRQPGKDGRESFLAQLRLLRRRGARLKNIPPEVMTALDTAVAVMANAVAIPPEITALSAGSGK